MDFPRSSRAMYVHRHGPSLLAAALLMWATASAAQRPAADRANVQAAAQRTERGDAFLAAGQYRDALAEFDAARQADTTSPAPLLGLGNAQEGLGRAKAAQKLYEAYIARRPVDPVGFENLGRVLASMGRNEESLRAFRDAQRLDPKSAIASRGAGLTLRAMGRRQEALRSLREAARLDGNDPMTWGELALLSLDMERELDAAGYWEEALRRDPGFFDARPDDRKRWEKVMAIVGPRPLRAPLLAAEEQVAATPAPTPATPAQDAETSAPVQPTDRAKPGPRSAVFARGPSSSGSGFVVARDRGYILTNKHVVRGCTDVKVRVDGSEARSAVIHAVDPDDDLALLEAPLPAGPTAAFREDPAVRPGDDVVAVGFPLAGLLADQVNVSTGSVNALAGLYNDLHLLQMSAPVQPGSSGGALFDASGNVVGVVVTKLNAKIVAEETGDIPQNVNFAVKGAVARDFLRSQGVAFHSASSVARRSNADVGEIGRQVTVLVECWK